MMKMAQDATGFPSMSMLVMGHNQEAFIGETIDSILNQDYDGPLEVVLCDDCSTDRTFEIMQEKAGAYTGPFHLILHRCPVNGRVMANMNAAFALSSGDWLLRVDGDDVMHPDRCRLMADAIRRFPEAVAVSGQFRIFYDGEPVPSIDNPSLAELRYECVSLRDFEDGRRVPHFEWWGGLMMLSRKVFEVFGPFPAECAVLDDTMFATRSLLLGDYVTLANGVLVYYRRHTGNMSSEKKTGSSLKEVREARKQREAYYRKGLPCHAVILDEMAAYAAGHGNSHAMQNLQGYFRRHFEEMRRLAVWWQWGIKDRWHWIWAREELPFKAKLSQSLLAVCPVLSDWRERKKHN